LYRRSPSIQVCSPRAGCVPARGRFRNRSYGLTNRLRLLQRGRRWQQMVYASLLEQESIFSNRSWSLWSQREQRESIRWVKKDVAHVMASLASTVDDGKLSPHRDPPCRTSSDQAGGVRDLGRSVALNSFASGLRARPYVVRCSTVRRGVRHPVGRERWVSFAGRPFIRSLSVPHDDGDDGRAAVASGHGMALHAKAN
jgi:hypothetical protein